MSDNLYQKYAAHKWSEVIGQPYTIKELLELSRIHKLPHAILLSGPSGIGKTTISKLIGMSITCENLSETGEPCGKCRMCQNIVDEDYSLGCKEYNGESIGIDQMRDIEKLTLDGPGLGMGENMIFFLEEFQGLYKSNSRAAESLLTLVQKKLPKVYFIITTSEVNRLSKAVISRFIHYKLSSLSIPTIGRALQKIVKSEGVSITPEVNQAIITIAESSQESLRLAIEMLSRCINGKFWDKETIISELSAVSDQNLLELIDKILKGDPSAASTYIPAEIIDRIRDALLSFWKIKHGFPLLLTQKIYEGIKLEQYETYKIKNTLDRLDELMKYPRRDSSLIDRYICECIYWNKFKDLVAKKERLKEEKKSG